LAGQLDRLADLPAGEAEIDVVVLYRSRPHGAGRVYESLSRTPLAGGNDE
jgi:hypothetical protein